MMCVIYTILLLSGLSCSSIQATEEISITSLMTSVQTNKFCSNSTVWIAEDPDVSADKNFEGFSMQQNLVFNSAEHARCLLLQKNQDNYLEEVGVCVVPKKELVAYAENTAILLKLLDGTLKVVKRKVVPVELPEKELRKKLLSGFLTMYCFSMIYLFVFRGA
jgi:hypothetical protein